MKKGFAGGRKIGQFHETKKPKSTLLADNTRGLRTTKQTKPKLVASAASNPIGWKWKIMKKKKGGDYACVQIKDLLKVLGIIEGK